MTRRKKTRGTGPLAPRAVPKTDLERDNPGQGKNPSRTKGRKPGARHNPNLKSKNTGSGDSVSPQDPRHGSKKPVPLFVEKDAAGNSAAKQDAKAPTLTPQQELEQLENDVRLQDLLEKTERGYALNKADQDYMNEKMARFQQLAEELGLDTELEDDPDDSSDDTDNDDWFDGSALDEWRKE